MHFWRVVCNTLIYCYYAHMLHPSTLAHIYCVCDFDNVWFFFCTRLFGLALICMPINSLFLPMYCVFVVVVCCWCLLFFLCIDTQHVLFFNAANHSIVMANCFIYVYGKFVINLVEREVAASANNVSS